MSGWPSRDPESCLGCIQAQSSVERPAGNHVRDWYMTKYIQKISIHHLISSLALPDSQGKIASVKSLLQHEMTKRGILLTSCDGTSYSHSGEDTERIVEAYSASVELVAKATGGDSSTWKEAS